MDQNLLPNEHDFSLGDARAFVQLLNKDEKQACTQEAALREKWRPYAWITPFTFASALGFGLFLSLATIATMAMLSASYSPWVVICVDIAAAVAVLVASLWMMPKVYAGAYTYRNWDMPLAESGFCRRMDKLLSEYPEASLIQAQERPLYVADFVLAKHLARQHRVETSARQAEKEEQEACARVHSAVPASKAA